MKKSATIWCMTNFLTSIPSVRNRIVGPCIKRAMYALPTPHEPHIGERRLDLPSRGDTTWKLKNNENY